MTGIEIRPPQLTGGTPQEQLGQLQRYLTALAQQLQFAFDAVQGGSPEMAAAPLPPRQQEQQRQERLRKIERTERNLQMLDGCFGSFVLMVGVPVALTIFAIWFVISHF